MKPVDLNRANLARLPASVRVPAYDVGQVTPGIVHLGLGGFHRAHMARYTHALMERRADALAFGLVGAGLRPADKAMFDSLAPLAAVMLLLDVLGPVLTQRAVVWANETRHIKEA